MQTRKVDFNGGCRAWFVRGALGLLGVLVLLLASAFIYARVADTRVPSVPLSDSQLVDIGGRKIHLRALGRAFSGPAVVLVPC